MTHSDELALLRANPDYDVDEMRTVHAPPARAPLSFPESQGLALQLEDLRSPPRDLPSPDPTHHRPDPSEAAPDPSPRPAESWPSTASLACIHADLARLVAWFDVRLGVLASFANDPEMDRMARRHQIDRAILEAARLLLAGEIEAVRRLGGG